MNQRRDGYLWGGQWVALDRILVAAGLIPSEFERVVVNTSPSWWNGKPRPLPVNQQYAELRHQRHDDVWFRVLEHLPGTTSDEDDDGCQYEISASPPPRWVPASGERQVEDFDDLIEYAESWATMAEQEIDARRTTHRASASARERASAEWSTTQNQPLAIPHVTGFVDEQLTSIITEGLRSAGVSDDDARRHVAASLTPASRAELVDALASKARDQWPSFLASWTAGRLADKVAGPVLDRSISFVFGAIRLLLGIS